MEKKRKTKWFCISCAVILSITGAAKIWSSFGQASLLTVTDPVIGIKFSRLLLFTGLVEAAVAAVFFVSGRQTPFLKLVAWLSTNFALYRAGLILMHWHHTCSCMGNLTDALHIRPEIADNIMKGVLAYLLIGSYSMLLSNWRSNRKGSSNIPPSGAVIEPA